ncbi:MAG: hypothetical protein DRR03_00275 [Gammaproteobacteria bacterium]|nr:MAG: hypothetical protein DRR03_00275 [Gammaproteobacteria bacterium]
MGRSMEALITQLQDDPEILRELRDQLIAHPDVLRQTLAALREQGRARDTDAPSLEPLDPWLGA